MQIDAQVFLPIAERAEEVCMLDLEASGLKGDYNSVLVVSVKPLGKRCITLAVEKPGQDRTVLKETRDLLHKYTVWVSYYGKGFDIPMIQSRLLRHGLKPLEKKHHIDLYWHMRAHTITARRSQAHLMEWHETPIKKMTLSPEVWNEVLRSPKKGLHTLKQRCDADVMGLEGLYHRVKHLIVNITR